MAALLTRCQMCRSRMKILHYTHYGHIRKAATNSAYILLPEMPPDTPENNPLLRLHENIELSLVKPINVVTGCAKLAIEHDILLGEHATHLKDPNLPKEFDTVFDPLEKVSVPMNYATKSARILGLAEGSDVMRKAFERVQPQLQRAYQERYAAEPVVNAVKELAADRANLTDFQRRVVDVYIRRARLNGSELSAEKRDHLQNCYSKLMDAERRFVNRTILATHLFSHTIEDFEKVVNLPKRLIQRIAVDKSKAGRGPWKVTLDPRVYEPFLEYCDDRMLRWNVWQANQNKSSIVQDSQNLSNHTIIPDIRNGRSDVAKYVGFENWPEMQMETRMAGSVENIIATIESMKAKFKPAADEEVARLEKFAMSEGHSSHMELWDFPYWRRREREHLFGINPEALTEYFPFEQVLSNMFSLCEELFGIKIVDATNSVDVLHKDVRYYSILENGTTIAGFYIDPYSRPPKVEYWWVEDLRERSAAADSLPLSYFGLSLAPPALTQPSLLDLEEVKMLFVNFGNGLQQLLTTVPYSDIAGQKNIDADTREVCGQLMEMILFNKDVLGRISSHYISGEQLPPEKIRSIIAAKKHFSTYDKMHQLYLAAYDMEVHISDKHWYQAMEKCWKEFMPIRRREKEEDNHACSLVSVYGDQWNCTNLYGPVWSEMIAAEIYGTLEEAGFENKEAIAHVGKRLRDTYLALGGSYPAAEVFRKFQGRDPSFDALFQYHNVS